MSDTNTVSRLAASNPAVGVAVASAQTDGAVLAGMQSGDTSLGGLLGALADQSQQVNDLLSKLQPNLGQNVNTQA